MTRMIFWKLYKNWILTGRSLLRNQEGVRHLTFNSHVTKEFLKQFVCMLYYVKQNITLLLTWFFHQWANLILSLKVLRVESFRPQVFQNYRITIQNLLDILCKGKITRFTNISNQNFLLVVQHICVKKENIK